MTKIQSISILSTLIITTVSGCTSFDDSLSPEEQAALEASQNYKSASNSIALSPTGQLTFMGQPLTPAGEINNQTQYEPVAINGTEHTVIAAQYDIGTSIYAISPTSQVADIGNSIPALAAPDLLTSTNYAGKYFERSINSSGEISEETSAAILLNYDPNAATLTAIAGPQIAYDWDGETQSFIGTNDTNGQAIAYENNTILGNYAITNDPGLTNYGTFWAIGE